MEPEATCRELNSYRNSQGCYCLAECMKHFIECSGMSEIVKVAGPSLEEGSSTQEMSSVMEVEYSYDFEQQAQSSQVAEYEFQGQIQSSQPEDETDSDEGLALIDKRPLNGIL